MSDQDRILEHEYDGIKEYDNPMPRWWVLTFWATIIFSVAYVFNVGGIGTGQGRIADYEADMVAWRAAHPQGGGPVDVAALLALADDSEAVEEGGEVYAKYCAACHAADGGGMIGPNLTDNAWLHGSSIDSIHTVIAEGVLAKGMPAWGKMLSPEQVDHVTAYVWSLAGSTPAAPKAPEGEQVTR
jgi:cytochrome c oxidase cbb3-type subunit 3